MKKRATIKNNYRETRLFTRRIIVLVVIIIAASIGLVSRLVSLQVINHDIYTTLSNQNQLSLYLLSPIEDSLWIEMVSYLQKTCLFLA